MTSDDGSQQAQQADAGLVTAIPAMPSVPAEDLYRGSPRLLLYSGFRHTLGWQDHRTAGPSFVVARRNPGGMKVFERHPFTEQGWESAWRTLAGADADAAAAIAANLAQRAAREAAASALRSLDGESLRRLGPMTFSGGSDGVPLTKGHAYDVRFLTDRILVCPRRSAPAVVEMPYRDVEAVEVSGSGSGSSSPGLILGAGLLGALLGLLIFGIPGCLLGALIFGLIGAVIGSASNKIETTVRIRGRDGELYFLDSMKRASAVRIELSEPLIAIENARAAQAGATATADGSAQPADPASAPITDRLSQLASLLQQGMLTRDEFDHLKAKLIAGS